MSGRSRTSRNRRKAPTSRTQVERNQLAVLQNLLEVSKAQAGTMMERVPDIPRLTLKRNKVYTFSRSTNTGIQMLNSSTAPVGLALALSLGDSFPNSSEFTNLFEQWRVVQVTWFFVPLYQGTVASPLYTWFDPDDNNTPTGVTEAQQSQSLRISKSGSYAERTYTPFVSQGGLATGTIAGYATPSQSMWIDTDSPSVRYYGLKAIIPANTNVASNVPLFSVEANAILQFRVPR